MESLLSTTSPSDQDSNVSLFAYDAEYEAYTGATGKHIRENLRIEILEAATEDSGRDSDLQPRSQVFFVELFILLTS